jgi:hypothetical protein
MAKTAGILGWFARCSALTLIACGSAEDAPAVAPPTPIAQAEAKVLSPADLAHGRLRKAASDGDFLMVKALLDRGVDESGLDPTDAQRNTPLHAAVEPGHFPVAKLLFQRGADITARNAAGETPVDIAIRKKHEAIIVLLGMRKADEAVPSEPAKAPLDPSMLDPGALIATLEDLRERDQTPKPAKPAADQAPSPLAPSAPTAEPALVAPEPKAEDQAATPAEMERKEQLCAQVESAIAQLSDAQSIAALKEAGISHESALQQLTLVQSTCQR